MSSIDSDNTTNQEDIYLRKDKKSQDKKKHDNNNTEDVDYENSELDEESLQNTGKQNELDICYDYTNIKKFLRHIRIIFKRFSPKRSLSKDSVDYIQNLILIFIEKVCTHAYYFMQSCSPARVTLLYRDVELGIMQVIPKEMNDLASKFISNTLENCTKRNNKPYAKEQPNIIIPPTRCRTYVRYFIGGYRISKKSLIVMAAGIEYVLNELLHAVLLSDHPKSTEFIEKHEIELVCKNDPGLWEIFSEY